MATTKYDLEILLPVHNEGDTIESTLLEIYNEIFHVIPFQFIICEDGSVDKTKEVIHNLLSKLPIKLLTSEKRKGYSSAIKDGMKSLNSPFLLCLNSDGQIDPRDFWKFWELKDTYDVIVGWRVQRADKLVRRLMSRIFYLLYQILFNVPLHDPSCSLALIKKQVVDDILPQVGEMRVGFEWEFNARVHRRGFRMTEVPINHRLRAAGDTKVYKMSKLLSIAYTELKGVLKVWYQTSSH